jgi:organic hydroperoxide reductase OsmC/OhrA
MVATQHHYRLSATWAGNLGPGTTGYREYGRDVTLSAEGKPDLLASADKPFRGDPARWNPEELLVASLSECHLLSFLHVAVTRGVVVTGYRDEATGTMEQRGIGGRFTEVVLHPQVQVAEPEDVPLLPQLHEEAHAACFVASSVNFPVRVEPVVA